MDFPNWTPKWVIDEFHEDFSEGASSEGSWTDGDEESRAWLEQVIQSPESHIVWEALDKYPDREARLAELASFVWSGHWGFGHVAIRKSEKAKIARDARKHVSALVQCLNKLTVQDGFAMNSLVASFADLAVSHGMHEELRAFHTLWNEPDSHDFVPAETIRRSLPAVRRVAANFLSAALFHDVAFHLEGGLCGSLDKWAERDPQVTKPEHENAKRLFFIRSLTSSFVESYGRPMRKETLALATVFFDCAGLDEAAISRLAPVRKRENLEE